MHANRATVVLLALGLISCRNTDLVGTDAVLRISPAQLDFPITLVGDSTSLRAELTNPSRASQVVPVQVPAPFAGPSSLEVPGGETVSFELLFLPITAGTFSKTVTLGVGQALLRLELTGTATAPITCAPAPAACRAMKPTAEGTCVEVDAVEDSACSTPCIEAGVCRQGRCLGAARSCDDANACTDDACAEETGCMHPATTCAVPSNPCQAPSCDPRTGCGITDVVDGTACGPNTCVTAKVCVAGECREVSAPEGSTCAPATPCRAAGTCQQRRCTQPQPTPLRPAWTYQSAGGALVFPGVGDRSGNVFWLENIGSTTWLVSVAFDGTERFRTRMAGVPNEGSTYPTPMSPLMLVSDTQLILLLRDAGSTTAGHRVEARSAVDGTLQWSRSRADFVAPLGLRDGVTPWMISAGVVGTPPRVFLNLRINEGGATWTSWIVALDASSGAFSWKTQSTYLSSAIADEDTVYAYEDLWRHVVLATSANGVPRWSLDVTGSAAVPASAFAGTLTTAFPAALRDARNGASTFQPANAYWGTRNTLLAHGRVIALDNNSLCARWFMVIDPATPRPPVVWQVPAGTSALGACLTEPLVTSSQSVLIASSTDLFEVGLDGLVRFTCPLPVAASNTASFVGATVLARGRWVASALSGRVEAFDVPAQETARRGWVTAGGGLDRANRPTR